MNADLDPSTNELLVYKIKESTIVGRPDNIPPPDIQLRGLSINNQHCRIVVKGTECVISGYVDSVIYVNGKEIFEPTRLYHGYRILLGNNHWFRVNAPGGHANPPEGDGDNEVDIISTNKELDVNDYDRIKSEMEEEKDKEIRKVQNEYESMIQEYRDILTDAMSVIPEAYSPPSELDSQSLIRLQEVVSYASDLVRTANQYSEVLQKDVKFSVTLRIPPSYLVPHSRFIPREDITSCVAIRVIFTSTSTDAVWSLDTLHEKLALIAHMYEEFTRNREEKGERGERVWWNESMGPDPFSDTEDHTLIGVANAYLACLFHFIPIKYSVPIISPQGKQIGKVNLIIQRLNSLHHDIDNFDELDIPFSPGSSYTNSSISGLHDILPDSKIYIRITIQNAQELPPNLQFIFCQYRMFGLEEVITVASVMELGQQNSISDGFIPFNHTKTFPVNATEEFIDFCREGVLTVDVLGHRITAVDFREFNQSTTIDNTNISERKWARIRSFVSLSAKIIELNVEGEHMPVELKESAQSLCGGTYQLKQGQSRKIQISVQNVQSSGRTELGYIQSVEIGSVVMRAKQDVPLDSFQEQDFNLLKEKWGQMLLLRKDYLDSEMKILMDKQDKTSEEVERKTKLIDEWLLMQQERNVLVHSDFSKMLGGSKNWYLPLGYESRPPIIFIDAENDLVHKTGSLLEENDAHMIQLKFKLENYSKLDAIATWDASEHEDRHLMSITATKDRVYIILRVTVAMKHPPGCKIKLRKRLQLCIVKGGSGGFFSGFKFWREAVRKSGVVYEIFCGLPFTEGVPTRIEPHPSILEPNQGESIVQAFRRGMEEISSQLELNRLRQEITLKEQLKKAESRYRNLPRSVSPGLHSGISSSPKSQDELNYSELDNIPGIVVSPLIHSSDKQSLLPQSITNSDLFTPPLSNSPVDFPATNTNITGLQTADITPTPNEPDPTPVTLVTAPSIEIPEEEKPQPVIKRLDMVIEVQDIPAELLTPDPSPTDASRTFTDSDSTESSDNLRSPIKSPLSQKRSAPVRKTSGARVPPNFPVKSFSGRSTTPDLGEKSHILPRHRISMGAASPAVDFKINDRVLVDLKAGNKVAKVRYIGPFQHAKDKTEIWVGLELTEPIGKNNGTVGTKVYFKCRENHGAFVPLSKVITVCDDRQQTRASVGPRLTRSYTPLDTSSRGRIRH